MENFTKAINRFALLGLCNLFFLTTWGADINLNFRNKKTTLYLLSSLQTDIYQPLPPQKIRPQSNTFLDLQLSHQKYSFKSRFEYNRYPLPGREVQESGEGITFLSFTYLPTPKLKITLGDFYEQFGSGSLLRSYEDRSLGIDNALRGGHITYSPSSFLNLKGLIGQPRAYFDRNVWNKKRGFLAGIDAEVSFPLFQHKHQLTLGVSSILNHDIPTPIEQEFKGLTYALKQKKHYYGIGGRIHYSLPHWLFSYEQGFLSNHPSAVNHFNFGNGHLHQLSATYSQKGLGIFGSIRRSFNFQSYTHSSANGLALRTNYLHPFVPNQSYSLTTLYPYATQAQNELAYQAEINYKIPSHTWLGKKGGNLKLAFAQVYQLFTPSTAIGEFFPRPSFFNHNQNFFQDYTVSFQKKVNRLFQYTLQYTYQYYNQALLGKVLKDQASFLQSHIFIYDGKHRFNKNRSLHFELQGLYSPLPSHRWLYLSTEYHFNSLFSLGLNNLYHLGLKYYPQLFFTANINSSRLQLSLGETREGYNCSGGICRLLPATRGIYISFFTPIF